MEYKHELKEDKIFIYLKGNIIFEDTTSVSIYLDKLLSREFEEAVLNLSEVTGITSSTIGAIIDFHKKLSVKGRKMRIKGMSEKAYSVFQYFKLDELFPIEK